MDVYSYQNLIQTACGNEHEGLQCEHSLSAHFKTHGKDSQNAPRHNTHLHMQIANQTQFQNLILKQILQFYMRSTLPPVWESAYAVGLVSTFC